MSASSVEQGGRCDHCCQPIGVEVVVGEQKFCCHGCGVAYQLLKTFSFDLINPVEKQSQDFSYLDQPETLKQFSVSENHDSMTFYVEGVQCGTCLWLLESLPKWVDGVDSTRLKMGQDLLTVKLLPKGSFRKVAEFLWAIGYKPHPIAKPTEADAIRARESRTLVLRMGVAAFVAGNIMLMTISVYSGVPKSYELFFNWISAALFLPVLFYSSVPFLKSAYRSIQLKRVNIDVPISMAIVFGALLSLYHLTMESGEVYFDSLAALVGLLLASRIFLKSIQKNFLSSNHLNSFITSQSIEIKNGSSYNSKWPTDIKAGDQFKVYRGQVIPVESKLTSKHARFNTALISGESLPKTIFTDGEVKSGYRVFDPFVELVAACDWSESGINRLMSEVEASSNSKTSYYRKLDLWAQWFTYALLGSASLFFVLYSFVSVDVALKRTLAFIIIACPCALAFAAPLLESLSLMYATRKGVLIKTAETLERLNLVKNIFLDKTGTVTSGNLAVSGWENNNFENFQIFYSMEAQLDHPIAKIIADAVGGKQSYQAVPIKVNEVVGQGVEAYYEGSQYYVGKLRAGDAENFKANQKTVGFYKDEQLINVAFIKEELQDNNHEAIMLLRGRNLNVTLLTGDNAAAASQISTPLGILFKADMLPVDKQKVIAQSSNSLMVGDGFNDLQAFTEADVSIAVQGSMESCLKVADVYFLKTGLQPLVQLYDISDRFHRGFVRVLSFSFAYNVGMGVLAMMGYVSPVVAAVLMPLSSFIVISLSFFAIYGRDVLQFVFRKNQGQQSQLPNLITKTTVEARGV